MEERVEGATLSNKMVHNTSSASGFAHCSDGIGVSANEGDVILNPFEGCTLVVKSSVSDTIAEEGGAIEPSKGAELVEVNIVPIQTSAGRTS